jgi:hypothetical protein
VTRRRPRPHVHLPGRHVDVCHLCGESGAVTRFEDGDPLPEGPAERIDAAGRALTIPELDRNLAALRRATHTKFKKNRRTPMVLPRRDR